MANPVNSKIMVLLKRHAMSPRDLSEHLGKDEADIVRRLRTMQKSGIVKSAWGSRLGKNVKLYTLVASGFGVKIQQDGIKIAYGRHKEDKDISTGRRRTSMIEQTIEGPPLSEQASILNVGVSGIIGRRNELRILQREDLSFIFIVGVAGLGKTSLAKKFAYEYLSSASSAPNDPGNEIKDVERAHRHIFWHTFKEIDTLAYLLAKLNAFLLSIGVDKMTRQLQEGQHGNDSFGTRELIATSAMLGKATGLAIIFDDYHKVKDEKISIFIKQLLDDAGSRFTTPNKNKVIVLSRYESPFYLGTPHCKELVLSGLPLDDAKQIIDLQLSSSVNGQMLDRAWKRYAGHPMALKIFSLFVNGKNEQEINNEGLLYKTVSIGELLSYFQREIFSILNDDELDLLTTMSVFRMPIRLDVVFEKRVFRTVSKGRRNLNYILHSLQKKMLISVDPAKHEISLHDMLRDAVYSTLIYPADLHARAAQYYLEMEGKTEHVVEAMYHLAKCGDTKTIIRLLQDEVVNETYKIIEQGYAGPLLGILAECESIRMDKMMEAEEIVYLYAVEGKALAMMQKQMESDKKLEEAIMISKDLPDRHILAHALKIGAEATYFSGRLDIVEEKLLAAVEILRSYKNDSSAQQVLKNVCLKLARLYFMMGKNKKSKVYSEKARKLAQ